MYAQSARSSHTPGAQGLGFRVLDFRVLEPETNTNHYIIVKPMNNGLF